MGKTGKVKHMILEFNLSYISCVAGCLNLEVRDGEVRKK